MITWFSISALLLCAYSILILLYWFGWNRIKYFNILLEPKTTFTIIIAARNEEKTITNCLQAIVNQNYDNSLIEVLVINDNSTDNTEKLVEAFAIKNNFIKLVNAAEHNITNKKAAVTLGFSLAKNSYCILTDADCQSQPNWLVSINSFIQKNYSVLVYAPVLFKANSVFTKMQALEFAGLVGIGGAAINLKNPNMCSAANLIVKKDVFFEVGGYQDNMHISSGDDEFLMHKVFKMYPNLVHFLKSKHAIVTTSANATIAQLASQRTRWVSKSTKYENRFITLILAMAYLFNFSIAFNLLYGFFNQYFLVVGLVQLIIKAMVEGCFLYYVLKLFNKQKLLIYLALAQPMHIIYVLIIGIWANIATYSWKGRELK